MENKYQRRAPSEEVIVGLCGHSGEESKKIARALYSSMRDIPLKEFYPYLNFNEAFNFWLGCFRPRYNGENQEFKDLVRNHRLHEIFWTIGDFGFRRLGDAQIGQSEGLASEYAELNPFSISKRSLEERLAVAKRRNQGADETFRRKLLNPGHLYVAERNYETIRRGSRDDDSRLITDPLLPAYISPEEVIPKYAKGVVKLLKAYPKEILYPEQLSLFA